MVGEAFSGRWAEHPNCKPENGTLYDGDEWPRMWWWITNVLPGSHVLTDDLVTGVGYTHPVGKEGIIVRHSSLKKFRLPNTQNLTERSIKSISAYGSDPERVYDYPGGLQNDAVGPHLHGPLTGNSGRHGSSSTEINGVAKILVNNSPETGNSQIANSSSGNVVYAVGSVQETRSKNIAVVYLRRF
jgi:hypothetical protein